MASPAIAPIELSLEERIKLDGATHKIVVDYTDLTDTAGTAKTLVLLPYLARDIVRLKAWDLVKTFDGGATSELTVKLGWNGTVDDDDGLLLATSIHEDATEILGGASKANTATTDTTFGQQELDVLDSLRALFNGLQAQDAGNIEAVFTSTGANLSTLTQGRVVFYIQRLRLTDSHLRPLSAL